MVITSRPSDIKDQTLYQLKNNCQIDFSPVIHTNQFQGTDKQQRKVDVCLEFGVDCMFDDSYSQVEECAKEGIQTYLITRPWNLSHNISGEKYIKRINTLSDALTDFR